MAVEVFMPKMSDHMEAGEIIRWLVKEGDQVEQGQVIMEVMTDKVVADLEAPASGILKGIQKGVEDGAVVPVGETFAFIAEPGEEVPTLPPLGPEAEGVKEAVPSPATPPSPEPAKVEPGPVRVSPVARRIAKELGVDLSQVQGTGPGGRIKEEDVRALAASQTEAKPIQAPSAAGDQGAEPPGAVRASPVARRVARELGVDITQVKGTGPGARIKEEDVRAFAEAQRARPVETKAAIPSAQPPAEEVEWLELSPIQRMTGQRMLESVQTAPQFALTVNVDMTNVLWLREALMQRIMAETGERLSVTAILVKIAAAALKSYPRANASFEDGRVKLYSQINVGVAVGTDDGLVVPVIKKADQKSLAQVIQELKTFQEKAQHMRFSSEDLSGGTFTISNLGMYGIDRFNAIVKPPESAILAVGRVVKTPVGMPDDSIALRPMMSMTLSVDHRSMDGLQGAKLLAEIKERIEKPYFLL
jgi:pyruvate dehydrogenase E2 component (dihydrolipoamide acetyltransferase)